MASSLLWCVILGSLLTCGHSSSSPCPSGCKCIERDKAMTTLCVDRNFTSIPSDIPDDTRDLYMKGHQIRVLRIGEFSRIMFLKSLILTQCGIESIEPNAFKGLHNVKMLDLQSNRLSRIQPYTFIGLFSLHSLILDKNPIRAIEDFAFEGVDLHKLSLEQNPDLMNMSSKAFDGASVKQLYVYNSSLSSESLLSLRNLQNSLNELSLRNNRRPLVLSPDLFRGFSFDHLNLNDNGITDVTFLQHAITADLSLEGNPVGSIDFRLLPSLKEVRTLRLGNTNFSNLNGSFFDGLTHLMQLHVSNNNISTLPENLSPVFSGLDRLSLSGNILHCNCQLRWFQSWLKEHHDHVIGEVRCKTPFDADLLTVAGKKMTCKAPWNVSVSQGNNDAGDVSLRCSAFGDPAPTVSWFTADGHCLGVFPASADRTRRVNVGVVYMTSCTGLTPGVATYTCVVSQMLGNATAELTLNAYTLLSTGSNCVPASHISLVALEGALSLLGVLGSL